MINEEWKLWEEAAIEYATSKDYALWYNDVIKRSKIRDEAILLFWKERPGATSWFKRLSLHNNPMCLRLERKIIDMSLQNKLWGYRWVEQAGYCSVILIRYSEVYNLNESFTKS